MAITEATIRVHYGYKNRLIDVEFGAGKNRVPDECLRISLSVKPHFQIGAVSSVANELRQKIPNVVVKIAHGVTVFHRDNPENVRFVPIVLRG